MVKATKKKTGRVSSSKSEAVISPRISPTNKLNYKARSVVVGASSRVRESKDEGDSGSSKNHSSLGARIAISLIAVLVIIIAGIYLSVTFAGKAIETPQAEAVSFDAMGSEQVLISAFDFAAAGPPFDFLVTASKIQGALVNPVPVKLRLTMTMDEKDMFHYQLNFVNAQGGLGSLLGQGLLGPDVLSMEGIYVNDDDVADIALSLEGPYVRITNLNYVTPEAATIEQVTVGADDGSGAGRVISHASVINAAAGTKFVTMFYINSTARPAVSFVWQNESDIVEVVEVGGNESSVAYALNWTPGIERGSVPFTITAQVDQEYSEKQFVMAVGGVEYSLLNNDGSVRLEMYHDANGAPWAHYQLAASAALQPLLAPCGGFPELSTLADSIATVYSYDAGVQQWRSGIPSNFGALRVGKGYLVKLKDGVALDVRYACTDEAMPPVETRLKIGWNLISFGGKTVRDPSMLIAPVGTQIRLVFEATPSGIIPDVPLDSLDPGRVYWVKVH